MPGSEVAKFNWIIPQLEKLCYLYRPLRILDVGTGSGLLADYLAKTNWDYVLDGVEVWEPYVEEFGLTQKYSTLYVQDAREFTDWAGYDVVMFGDILEHMSKEDAIALWNSAAEVRHRFIAIPTVHCPQGEEHGNPYEVHVKDDWSHREVMDSFPGLTACSPQYAIVKAYMT